MRAHALLAPTLGILSLLSVAAPRLAHAGCGFYAPPANAPPDVLLINDADQVAIMREGTRFGLTMSTNYRGPAEDFAMIVPVPVVLKQEDVKTLDPEIFKHLERVTAPQVQEYWEENPCEYEQPESTAQEGKSGGSGAKPKGGAPGGGGGGSVTVEAQFIQGEYEIVVLGATESDALEKWLIDHAYRIPKGASAALAPYVAAQQKFVVAKVDAKKVKRDASGAIVLSPLRFVYETPDMRLPVRLGLLNAPTEPGKKQDLIIYVLGRKRVESANYANAFMPTNVDLDSKVLDTFGPFYASLFDAVLERAGRRAVVTETAQSIFAVGLAAKQVEVLGGDAMLGMDGKVSPPDLVLTRLHTRYDAATLSEDIVFRHAEPVAGGYEGTDQQTPTPHTINAYLTRFAVRHEWFGNIECAEPKRGKWGPPPHGKSPRGIKAVDVASVPRDVSYATYLKSEIPALGVSGPKFGAPPTVDAPAQWLTHWGPRLFAAGLCAAILGFTIVLYCRNRAVPKN